jgi:hypothetical protein
MVDHHRSEPSLEQIEGDTWGDPPAGATSLVRTAHALRRKPVDELTPEDLRLLIAQRVGLDALVPRALTQLERDPMLEGDYYPGDVLVAVLRVPESYWSAKPTERLRLQRVLAAVEQPDSGLAAQIRAFEESVRRASPGRSS